MKQINMNFTTTNLSLKSKEDYSIFFVKDPDPDL